MEKEFRFLKDKDINDFIDLQMCELVQNIIINYTDIYGHLYIDLSIPDKRTTKIKLFPLLRKAIEYRYDADTVYGMIRTGEHSNEDIYIPNKCLNNEICLALALENSENLKLIPKEFKIKEMYLKIKKDKIIRKILEEKNKLVTEFIVRQNVNYLKMFDEKELTLEICLEALGTDLIALKYIPKKFYNKKLFKLALNKYLSEDNDFEFSYFKDFPKFFNKKTVKALIKKSPANYYNLPVECREAIHFAPALNTIISQEDRLKLKSMMEDLEDLYTGFLYSQIKNSL